MNQRECVIEVMRANGGYATLGQLYMQTPVKDWKTKTPFATIRRIVQDNKFFFRITPGLWALKDFKGKLPAGSLPDEKKAALKNEFNHTYYQGLVVELGNLRNFETFVPYQDKNRLFLGKPLNEITALSKIYDFSFNNIVNNAKTVDVTWFNSRHMPSMFFEVEHSTTLKNSLLKFLELQDFNSQFHIVAPSARGKEFNAKMESDVFRPIKSRTKFFEYEGLSQLHSKESELAALRQGMGL